MFLQEHALIQALSDRLEHYEPVPLGAQRKTFSVLLPLVYHEEAWQILYELRAQHVSQPGEVSFPGGGIEEGETPMQAAVRETEEELGIAQDSIVVLGTLDYVINDGAWIHCYVGVLTEGLPSPSQLNTQEVEEVFLVPLDWLQAHPPEFYELAMQPVVREDFPWDRLPGRTSYRWSRRINRVCFYPLTDTGRNLWGYTATMTEAFMRLLAGVVFEGAAASVDDTPVNA